MMNFSTFLFFSYFLSLISCTPLSGNNVDDETISKISPTSTGTVDEENENDISITTTTTHPTFSGSEKVDVLDTPIERIEIRLMDENTTKTEVDTITTTTTLEVDTTTTMPPEREEETQRSDLEEESTTTTTTTTTTEEPLYKRAEYVVQSPSTPEPVDVTPTPSLEYSYSYSPTEYATTADPIVVGHDESYFSTVPTNHEIQAKAWISHAPPVPQFDGDIDEDDLPPQPSQETNTDESEPEEECLANKENLSPEVISRLQEETANLYKLVRKRNELQKKHCQSSENQVPSDHEVDANCNIWRSEKLVYYYKLMRKTYCRVEQWPNPSKVKKTYGEYLNLFGTFYAFQK